MNDDDDLAQDIADEDDDRDPPFVSKSDEYARKRGYPNIDALLDNPQRGQGDKR